MGGYLRYEKGKKNSLLRRWGTQTFCKKPGYLPGLEEGIKGLRVLVEEAYNHHPVSQTHPKFQKVFRTLDPEKAEDISLTETTRKPSPRGGFAFVPSSVITRFEERTQEGVNGVG